MQAQLQKFIFFIGYFLAFDFPSAIIVLLNVTAFSHSFSLNESATVTFRSDINRTDKK
jgi:hypothetical protein